MSLEIWMETTFPMVPKPLKNSVTDERTEEVNPPQNIAGTSIKGRPGEDPIIPIHLSNAMSGYAYSGLICLSPPWEEIVFAKTMRTSIRLPRQTNSSQKRAACPRGQHERKPQKGHTEIDLLAHVPGLLLSLQD